MKISASKKTIAILSICFVFLIVGGISLFYKDVITNGFNYNRWFVLDKYAELLEDCEWEKGGKEVRIKCKGLLYPISELEKNLSTHCYNIITIPKELEKKTFVFNVCEGNDRVKWEGMDEWMEKGVFTPVRYTVVFNRSKPFTFEYFSLEIENVNEKEYYAEFYKHKDIADSKYSLSLETNSLDAFNNYFFSDKDEFGLEEMGVMYLLKAQLLNKEVKNDVMLLTFNSKIQGEDIQFTIRSNFINFSKEGDENLEVGSSNIGKIDINKNYQLILLYQSKELENLKEKMDTVCNVDEVHISQKPLCGNKQLILDQNTKPTTGKEIVENLLHGEKDLHNAFLFYMISVD
ncbi:MAG TPA: hypothetical protein VJY47_01285 [Candidatus Dojkabacteria bacterium]|nr:hypothetical protein [Candidatus Dojkabacteria bacterium]